MNPTANRIAENLAAVRDRIAQAAARSGRTADAVRLVAVTKYVGPDLIRPLVEAGCRDLGESRPQALWDKAAALAGLPVKWHLVGHLQRNKIRRTLPLVSLIHSVDSQRLVEAIEAEAAGAVATREHSLGNQHQRRCRQARRRRLTRPNRSSRWPPHQPHLEVLGLMTMARLEGNAEAARADFARLRDLRDRLAKVAPPNVSLNELSMGMSGDYAEAIEEGATIVRIGSALFDGLAPA